MQGFRIRTERRGDPLLKVGNRTKAPSTFISVGSMPPQRVPNYRFLAVSELLSSPGPA